MVGTVWCMTTDDQTKLRPLGHSVEYMSEAGLDEAVSEAADYVTEPHVDVGDIVIYTTDDRSNCIFGLADNAAIVTEVEECCVSLCVLSPEGSQFVRGVMFSEQRVSGTWRHRG